MTYEIDISPEDEALLRSMAVRDGISVSELVFRAVMRPSEGDTPPNDVILATPESQ